MATGANTAPLGKLHPVLAARLASAAADQTPESQGLTDGAGLRAGRRDSELQKHLEAAKRAAEALFQGELDVQLVGDSWVFPETQRCETQCC